MLGLRLPELLIILVVVVLMFGSKKLPELGDALGKGIRAFKKASDHAFEEDGATDKSANAGQGQLQHGSPVITPSSTTSEKVETKV